MSHQSDLIADDIDTYLKQHENKELLRFLTCGSVDDGKSTLIGRLLHDSKMIYEDQLAALESASKKVGTTGEQVDLALLVDGLQAEREQGITIDVAYRYFSTARRKFIIADTPGHEQYTRNMATGASTCDLAIILIDARHGVQVQTRRHSFIVSLLGIKHVVVAINKMDLVEFSQARFEQIKADYLAFAEQLDLPDIRFVPISALNGDNVVNASAQTPWYQGEPLMSLLENVEIAQDINTESLRFPVQYVNRPNLDFRGYCGTLTAGIVRPGDEIQVLPSGKTSRVKSIVTFDGELQEAFPPMSVTLTLEDEIDVSRGDMIVHRADKPQVGNRFDAHLVWMAEEELIPGRTYDIKLAAARSAGRVTAIRHRIDVNTLEQAPAATLGLNEIARVEIDVERPLVADDYRRLPGTGAFILVDRLSNATVGAGMIQAHREEDDAQGVLNGPGVQSADRARRFGQQPGVIQLDAAEASSRLAYSLEKRLFDRGRLPLVVLQNQLPAGVSSAADLADLLRNQGFLVLTDAPVDGALRVAADPAADLPLDPRQDLPQQLDAILQALHQQKLI